MSGTTTTLGDRLRLAAVIVAGMAAAAGFATKIFEFVQSFLTGTTLFALEPVSVYVTVASGFACLFVWTALRGMFRDIEAPKHTMLERERAYDEATGEAT